VPSLLVSELAAEMSRPEELRKSILLSGALNLVVFVGVGLPVAALWGVDNVTDPITISPAWPAQSPAARLLSAFLCIANFVGYCLDSVPLARWCQRHWMPRFRNEWSASNVSEYALTSLPAFIFALIASVFVGQPGGVFTMLAWATALTVPALNLILPAVFALVAHSRSAATQPSDAGASDLRGPDKRDPVTLHLTYCQRIGARAIVTLGVIACIVCLVGAAGRSFNEEVRGPTIIGCPGWIVYDSQHDVANTTRR